MTRKPPLDYAPDPLADVRAEIDALHADRPILAAWLCGFGAGAFLVLAIVLAMGWLR